MKTYTTEDFAEWGRKGGKATAAKLGSQHYKDIQKKSIKSKKKNNIKALKLAAMNGEITKN